MNQFGPGNEDTQQERTKMDHKQTAKLNWRIQFYTHTSITLDSGHVKGKALAVITNSSRHRKQLANDGGSQIITSSRQPISTGDVRRSIKLANFRGVVYLPQKIGRFYRLQLRMDTQQQNDTCSTFSACNE